MIKKYLFLLKDLDRKKIVGLVLLIVAVGGVSGSLYFYYKYKALTIDPNAKAEKQTAELVAVLGKIIELPKNEVPTIAIISDRDKLKNQTFFTQAQNGDVLVAYITAKQAILYRPSVNKIINVAPINVDNPQPNSTVTTKEAPDHVHTIAYYNGTKIVGLATRAEEKVNKKYPQEYKTVMVKNAAQNNYTETLVVDLSADHGQEVIELANLLGGKVATLPSSEVAPSADILVIMAN